MLFADLVGSTAHADSEDPERTRVVLERFYGAMADEIERAGGTVEKFAGDAVMAAFGVPSALEDHAERALHAALAMQRRLTELSDGRLDLRIGVNTGDVFVGEPRAGSSFVSGDAVNVAARLETAAAAGSILVGERTVAAVRGAFEFEQAESVTAKGKPAGVVARRLIRARIDRCDERIRINLDVPQDSIGRAVDDGNRVSTRAAASVDRDETLFVLGLTATQAGPMPSTVIVFATASVEPSITEMVFDDSSVQRPPPMFAT